jgi:hypothetical protein
VDVLALVDAAALLLLLLGFLPLAALLLGLPARKHSAAPISKAEQGEQATHLLITLFVFALSISVAGLTLLNWATIASSKPSRGRLYMRDRPLLRCDAKWPLTTKIRRNIS